MADNDLRITIYSSGTTVLEPFEYAHATNLQYGSLYPVGWGDCSFFLPGDPTYLGRIAHGMTVVISNGFVQAWAGRVTKKKIAYDGDTAGLEISCIGHFGDIMMVRGIRKPWADTGIDEATWVWNAGASGANLCTVDREAQIKFMPKIEAWADTNGATVDYTAPTGQTVKKVDFVYDLQEGGQAWQMELYTNDDGVLWSRNTTGTGSASTTLGTPRQTVRLIMRSMADQTPTAPSGTIYGKFTNIVVYTETSAINPTEILTDVVGLATEFSTDLTQIASNTLSLVPFVAAPLTYAEIIARAAGYGDASFNPYAFGVRGLDATNKPILFYEAYPALTDYDYTVSLDSKTLQSFEAEQDVSAVRNYICMQFQDTMGREHWMQPDADANLTDAASVAAYGRRDEWIPMQTTSVTTTVNYGRRFLAAKKDLQWRVSGSFPVVGYIKNKDGSMTPASLIMAGQRVRIANYLNDLNGTGLTLLITGVDYNDATQTATITVGESNALDVLLARIGGFK